MSDRFVVRAITGYSLKIGSYGVRTSYSVLDTHYNHIEAARFYVGVGGGHRRGNEGRRRAAEARCAELNQWADRQLVTP